MNEDVDIINNNIQLIDEDNDTINKNDIIAIKQKIKDCINIDFYDYIKNKIIKNVKDCNFLYTQVCYLIKLFLLYEYEQNIIIDYDLNENFIRFCFQLLRNGNKKFILNNTNEKNDIKNRLVIFYNDFNTKNIAFNCPIDLDSTTHITNALSRDIATNIKNNITLNFYKYIKEYIKINLKLEFEKDNRVEINSTTINYVFNDIISNTYYSNNIFHEWIINNKKLIIPNFDDNIIQISTKSLSDALNKNVKSFIIKYIKDDDILCNIIKNNKFKVSQIKIIQNAIYNDIVNNTFNSNLIFHDWIKNNILLIINIFNSINCIDMDAKLISKPFIFVQKMLFMNKNLELNKSKKKYQIIPIRTNMTPKFIPINTHALVDILGKDYLDNIKNYYHNNTENGIDVWNKYFLFTSDFIKNTLKKGFVFSGTILTNGHEVVINFYSKKYIDSKKIFHCAGKKEIKNKKELIKDLLEEEKEVFLKKYEIQKKDLKNKKKELNKENTKLKKDFIKKQEDEKIKNIENELSELNNIYNKNCEDFKKKYLDDLDKNNNNNSLEKYKSSIAYLSHCYDRDKETLITDFNNNIDEKYNELIINDDKINKEIDIIKINLKHKKNELKRIKIKFQKISKDKNIIIHKENIIKNNKYNNLIDIKRNKIINIMNKIRKQRNLLNYECNDKIITKNHIDRIKNNLINLMNNEILKIYKINNLIETSDFKIFFDNILSILLIEIKSENMKYLENIIINKFDKDIKNNEEYYLKYNKIINEIKEISKELCKKLVLKKNNEQKIKDLFKNKQNEYMKIDTMSKKYLEVLNKLNWCVNDPGVTSIFNILSKDGKKHYSYTKKLHNNRISLFKINKRINKIKKEKIEKIEQELNKEDIRLKTSNNYETFKKYYNKKMLIYKELEMLYDDEMLNKLKWNMFINEKRAEKMIINDIKKKFGSDVVLILGDWSMNKQVIKGISSTPNKKYTKILENNFITLKINEFRTSIIHNKLEQKCENYVKKYDNNCEKIRNVYLLERIKNKNENKYKMITKDKKIHKILVCKTNKKFYCHVDRDNNSTKNMNNIVLSYINTNYRPKTFVMGTLICKHSLKVL